MNEDFKSYECSVPSGLRGNRKLMGKGQREGRRE